MKRGRDARVEGENCHWFSFHCLLNFILLIGLMSILKQKRAHKPIQVIGKEINLFYDYLVGLSYVMTYAAKKGRIELLRRRKV